jgi:hypothetical protein
LVLSTFYVASFASSLPILPQLLSLFGSSFKASWILAWTLSFGLAIA